MNEYIYTYVIDDGLGVVGLGLQGVGGASEIWEWIFRGAWVGYFACIACMVGQVFGRLRADTAHIIPFHYI